MGLLRPHHCSSRGGSLLRSIYADARYIDDVISFQRQWLKYIRGVYGSSSFASITQYSGNQRAKKNLRRDVLLGVLVKAATKAALPTLDLMVDQPQGGKWVHNPRTLGEAHFNWESVKSSF